MDTIKKKYMFIFIELETLNNGKKMITFFVLFFILHIIVQIHSK